MKPYVKNIIGSYGRSLSFAGCSGVLFIFLFVFTCFNVGAQTATVKVADTTGLPVPGVSVSYDKHKLVTNANGEAVIECTQPVKVTCAYIGYETQIFTIAPGQTRTIIMILLNQNLKQVVITGQLSDTKQQESAENVKVIDAEEIKQLQVNNLQDLLATQLNFRITEDNILGSNLTMNGLGGENVKVMIDGVPVIGRQNGNLDLSQVLLNNIERVEIIEGSMSVLYSTDASGGVINLITKKQSPYKYSLQVNNSYESPGSFYTDGLFMEQFKKSHLSVYGGRYYFDGYPKLDSTRFQTWKPYIKYFGGADYGFTKGNYEQDLKLDIFTQTTLARGVPVITPYEAYAFDQRYITDRYNVALFQKWHLKNNSEINSTVSYNYYSNNVFTYRKDLTTLQNDLVTGSGNADTTIFHHVMARALYVNAKPGSTFRFQTGFEGNYETASGNELKYKSQYILELAGLFIGEWNITHNLLLKPGIRFNYISHFNNPVIPSANLKWDINKSTVFRFGASRGYRAPALKELDLQFVDVNHNIHGNPDLQAEKSWGVNTSLNYRYGLGGLDIDLQPSLFFNYISNQIILALSDSATNYYTYSNLQKTNDYGGTMTASVAGKYIKLGAAYGITAVTFSGQSVAPNTIWSPEFDLRITGKLPRSQTSLAVIYKNVGESPVYVTDNTGNVTRYQTEGYTLMDAILSQPIMKGFLNFSAGVKNIFNVNNIASTLPNTGVHSDNSDISIARGRYFIASLQINLDIKKKADKK